MSTKMCAASNTLISWDQIDFKKVERRVKKLQKRIAWAYDNNEMDKVVSLQHKMIHSFYAKVLAVEHVISNKGSRTPGVDHVVWSTPEEMMEAVFSLKRRGYKPKPLRRIYVPKPNGKLRPLSIPAFQDRAMQTLYKFALEPIAEITADNGSYGYRQNRSAKDAVTAYARILSTSPDLQWVLKADVQSCFDNISHEWILNHIPMDKEILHKILKCGFVSRNKFHPTNKGIPQGGCLSSVICNMTLDGMENLLANQCGNVRLIRYADDFIVIGPSREILVQSVVPVVQKFLSERGLSLSHEKTIVTHIENSFTFLGYVVYQQKGQICFTPTKEKIDSLLKKIDEILSSDDTTQETCKLLNYTIRGWMNYYAGIVTSQSLSNVKEETLSHLMSLTGDNRIVEFVEEILSSYDCQ